MMELIRRGLVVVGLLGLFGWFVGSPPAFGRTGGQGLTARSPGDLKTAAHANGTVVVQEVYLVAVTPFSLGELTRVSPQIIIGRVTWNVSRLAKKGHSIEALFAVEVEETLKGNLAAGTSVQVVVPGGRYGFDDGSWAQVNVPGFRRPCIGYRYVFFMQPNHTDNGRSEDNVFSPVFGPLGIFELPASPESIVSPSGLPQSAFSISVVRLGMNADAFVTRLRTLLR